MPPRRLPRMRPARPRSHAAFEAAEKMEPIYGLGGEVIGARYVPYVERFGIDPTSVWTMPTARTSIQTRMRAFVGDTGELRAGAGRKDRFLPWTQRSQLASVFDPVLAGTIITAYSEEGDQIIDPFGGGGTRALVAAGLKRRYTGLELRSLEADLVRQRIAELDLDATILTADASRYVWPPSDATLCFTCPPYFDFEKYSDDPDDLSNMPSYDDFLLRLGKVISNTRVALHRAGAYSVWVVGEIRDKITGELLDIPGDVVRLHQAAGFWLYDRIIYVNNNPLAKLRTEQFDESRKTVRVHEHVLVFRWGGR